MNASVFKRFSPPHPGGERKNGDEPMDPRNLPKKGTNRALAVAALERGLFVWYRVVVRKGKPVRRMLVGNGKKSVVFSGGGFNVNDSEQRKTSIDKQKTKALLQEHSINTPEGMSFLPSDIDQALGYARKLKYPVFVKPVDGARGEGVSKAENEEQLMVAWEAIGSKSRILLEEFFDAEEYRFSCVDGKVIAVVKRVPANIVGDGESTVRQLISEKNIKRGNGFATPKIKVDDVVKQKLKSLGLTLESVPGGGEVVYLRDNSNVSTGGDSIDCTDEVHPGYKEAIGRASSLFSGIVITGWDVFIKNIDVAPSEYNWAVCEVNHAPMISLHHYPWEGRARDVAGAALDHIFGPLQSVINKGFGSHDVTKVGVCSRALVISGRVQKVGFTRWLKDKAVAYGIDGWVRSSPDGSIEAMLAGEKVVVTNLVSECMVGPAGAEVSSLYVKRWEWPVRCGFTVL